jgi:hypothetical protein
MTDQELADAALRLFREQAKLPPLERVRDLIEAGIIDEQGRVLIGAWDRAKKEQKAPLPNGPGDVSPAQKAAGT